jgi:very-short-patch-repair endonuclease
MESVSFEQRKDIVAFYAKHTERIMESTRGYRIDKYRIPHLDSRTPIEKMAFNACITEGFAMYPEYPVGRFFLDLGNPRLKIGLELDGLEFHQDWVKDSKRDVELWERHGWKVFRASGARCNVVMRMPEEDDLRAMQNWLHVTIEGLIYSMRTIIVDNIDEDYLSPLQQACISELSRSRIIDDFPIVSHHEDEIVENREPVRLSDLIREIAVRFGLEVPKKKSA